MMKMVDCPEYIRCSAAICPLDPDWRVRGWGDGDSTCLFLRETMKPGAAERLAVNAAYQELHVISLGWIEAEKLVVEQAGENGVAKGRGGHLRSILAAAKSGSTLEKWARAGARLAKAREDSAG